MNDTFEIEVHPDGVYVWATNWKGSKGLTGDFNLWMTKRELARELYELLAASGCVVRFVED